MKGLQYKISLAFEFFDQGEYKKAEEMYAECLEEITNKNSNEYEQILHGMGYVKSHLKKFSEARKIYKKIINLAEQNSNVEDEAIAIHQLGMVERMAGNYEVALNYFIQEYKLLSNQNIDRPLNLSANLYEQAYIHLLKKDLITAEKLMNKSLEYALLSDDKICIGCSYRGLGEIYKSKGNQIKAKEYFEKAINAFNDANDPFAIKEIEALMN